MVIANKSKKTRKEDEWDPEEYLIYNPDTVRVVYPEWETTEERKPIIPKKDMEVERARKIVNDYVNAIIFKNPLENLYAYEHLSDVQRKALEAIQSDELEKKLAIYRNKRDTLAEQIETLNKQAKSLSSVKEDINRVREEYTLEQAKHVETVEKLRTEVAELTQKKDELSSIIDTLNESYDKYQ